MFSTKCHRLVRNILAGYDRYTNVDVCNGAAGICSSSVNWSNSYYESLGIPQSSTQSDIKAAYYKLSMIYHPDKNQGSDSAAIKFREITKAYEVLGNYRLRRLYDKGIIHTAGTQYAQHPQTEDIQETPDDAETKFYKSRFRKSTVADSTGRTPIYDFDEWSRMHYGKSFERRQAAQAKYNRQQAHKHNHVMSIQNEIIIFGLILGVCIMYVIFAAESALDTPQKAAERRAVTVSAENSKKE